MSCKVTVSALQSNDRMQPRPDQLLACSRDIWGINDQERTAAATRMSRGGQPAIFPKILLLRNSPSASNRADRFSASRVVYHRPTNLIMPAAASCPREWKFLYTISDAENMFEGEMTGR
jgi:hypothetical protein